VRLSGRAVDRLRAVRRGEAMRPSVGPGGLEIANGSAPGPVAGRSGRAGGRAGCEKASNCAVVVAHGAGGPLGSLQGVCCRSTVR
jgi:hypothetical protein